MSAPAALPSVSRDALTSDWAKLLGADGKYVWSDIASIIALVIADGNGYQRKYYQGFLEPFSPAVDTTPNSIMSGGGGTDQIAIAEWRTGSTLLIKFRMKYALADGDVLTLIGKIRNLSDDSEYNIFATDATSQDFVFSQPSDDGFVEVHVNLSDYGPAFSANSEWRGGAEPSKQNGRVDVGSVGATGPYLIEFFSVFSTAGMGSSLTIEEFTIDLIKGPT